MIFGLCSEGLIYKANCIHNLSGKKIHYLVQTLGPTLPVYHRLWHGRDDFWHLVDWEHTQHFVTLIKMHLKVIFEVCQ